MRRSFFLTCVTVLLFACIGLVAQTTSIKPVSFVGTTKFKPGKTSSGPVNEIVEGPEVDETFDIPGISGNNSPVRLPSNFVPRPAGNPIGSGHLSRVQWARSALASDCTDWFPEWKQWPVGASGPGLGGRKRVRP
jgi:hypothetical protein